VAYDALKYGKLFPKSNHGLIYKQRGIAQTQSVDKDPDSYSCFGYHPYFGYNNNCNLTSEKGFLKEHTLKENQQQKNEKKLRILILGGSVASHLSRRTSIEKELERQLKMSEKLSSNFPGGVSVFNAAHGGYKQPQQLIILNTLLSAGYEFEGVVNVAGFNEIALPIAENFPQKISILLPRSQSLLESKEHILHGPYRHFIKFANLHPLTRIVAHAVAQEYSKHDAQTQLKPYQFDPVDSTKDAAIYAIQIWKKASYLAYNSTSAQGGAYLEYIQPNQYYQNSKKFTQKEKLEAISSTKKQPYRKPIEDYYKTVQISNFGYLPRENIKDGRLIYKDTSTDIYNDDCCHMNSYGMELLAKDISNSLLSLIEARGRHKPVKAGRRDE